MDEFDDDPQLKKLLDDLDLEDVTWRSDMLEDRLLPTDEEKPSWMD